MYNDNNVLNVPLSRYVRTHGRLAASAGGVHSIPRQTEPLKLSVTLALRNT